MECSGDIEETKQMIETGNGSSRGYFLKAPVVGQRVFNIWRLESQVGSMFS
jgi:hypothetical protein